MKVFFSFLLVFTMVFSGVMYAQVQKTIIAEGLASGSDLKARDEALNRALRRAVEQAVGILVDSESMTQNYQLLEDNIYSDVKGYVMSYDVIDDNQGSGGTYRIKISALVALGRLDKQIKALNIIKERKQNPRLMVMVQEFVDGLEQPTNLTATELESVFINKDFPVVDKSQFDMVKQRDVAASYNDPKKAAALGREYGAEVVIVAQAVSNLLESSRPYGVKVYAYTADITAKAIKTDTARIIATTSESATARGSGRIPTANNALKDCSKKSGNKLMRSIIDKWRSEVFNVVDVSIVVSNVKPADRVGLKQEISDIRGVQGVYERSYGDGIMVMDIKVDGAIWERIEEYLADLPAYMLKLQSKTQNKIEFSLQPKMRQQPQRLQPQ